MLLVLAVSLVLAAPAAAVVYPVRPYDAPLLARVATPYEQIAESVAQRLTRKSAVVGTVGSAFTLDKGIVPGVLAQ